jgi:hypothetical protein
MPDWASTKLPLAVPAEHRALGNRAADIFGPNTREDLTFPDANAFIAPEDYDPIIDSDIPPTHCLAKSQFVLEFVPLLETRNPDQWEPLLAQMASVKGKEPLTREEVETLCEALLFGSECNNLVRVP